MKYKKERGEKMKYKKEREKGIIVQHFLETQKRRKIK